MTGLKRWTAVWKLEQRPRILGVFGTCRGSTTLTQMTQWIILFRRILLGDTSGHAYERKSSKADDIWDPQGVSPKLHLRHYVPVVIEELEIRRGHWRKIYSGF
jgi:hypothetical protein